MDQIHRKPAVFRSKPARTLLIISVVLTIAITLVTFVGTFLTSMTNEILLLQGYVNSIPALMQERVYELQSVYQTYTNDYISRGDIATTMYDEYDELDQQARLEFARRNSDALNVTLLDSSGKFIASATGEKPSNVVEAAYKAIDDDPAPLFDATLDDINEDNLEDEDGYVPETDSLPMVYDGHTADGNIIMVEFDYTPIGQIIAERFFSKDAAVFERAISGLDAYGFMTDDSGEISGYPLDGMSGKERERIESDAKAAFTKLRKNFPRGTSTDKDATADGIVSLLGVPHLAVITTMDDLGFTYMVAVPLASFAGFMFLCDLAIIILVVVGYVLFARYATNTFRQERVEMDGDRVLRKSALMRTFPGIVVVLVVTGVLSGMLLMLEGLSNTARSTVTQHDVIQSEADYAARRKSDAEEEYTTRYRSRATAIARLLTDHPELRTRESLKKLNDIAQSSHLMLFSEDGKELFDSSGFTGFDVYDKTTGSRPEWQAVLQGYIQIETPTTVNPITGQSERTIATHITNKEGLPDGFLLMVVNDDNLMEEIGDASLEGTVNNFAALGGQLAAVIDNKTGLFSAHTDPTKIGEAAEDYLSSSVIGHNFNGFTNYADNAFDVYVSSVSADGKTTLVITDGTGNEVTKILSWIMIGIILALILFVYYPSAALLCARHVYENPVEKDSSEDEDHPMMIFYRGYVAYLAALAIFSGLGAYFGFWKAFQAVYGVGSTPGIHLFSLWGVLFTFAILSYLKNFLHSIIARIEKNSSASTKTYARLTDSLVTYAVTVAMFIAILTQLGVNTATIIGSVSIISIAIGMGSQDLVKDIVAGLFLTYEGTIKVGDLVEIGGFRGRVTDMGIRTTVVSWYGESKIFNNSSVKDVLNSNGEPERKALSAPISYDADLEEVEAILAEELPLMMGKIPGLVKPPQYEGIDSLGDSSVNLCIAIYVDYPKRNGALRYLAREFKIMCDRRGIEIPFNQLVLHNGDLANGDADMEFVFESEKDQNAEDTPKD